MGASRVGMQLYAAGLIDVLTFSGLVRGVWGIVNWCYQCCYFGLRMWLVFVLHAFSVGCFMSLWDGFTGAMGLGVLALGGLLGAAIVLGGMCLGYLGIQVYVYVSFMTSFLYYCVMGWYRDESVDVGARADRAGVVGSTVVCVSGSAVLRVCVCRVDGVDQTMRNRLDGLATADVDRATTDCAMGNYVLITAVLTNDW